MNLSVILIINSAYHFISKSFIKKIDLKVMNKEVKCNECHVFDKYKAQCGCIAL